MEKGFWEKLKKPIVCLAPMADVTDVAFRALIAKYGNPDVIWTEFVSADGLFLAPPKDVSNKTPEYERVEAIALEFGVSRGNPLLHDLLFTEKERPIVAQFFSRDLELMKRAAELAVALGFDGIDINMGCPADVICKQGSGAAMIKEPEHACAIIRATKEGAGNTPVSVKTRLGFNKIEIDTWLPSLFSEYPALVTLHARTRKEMSKVPAQWDKIAYAVELRNSFGSESLLFGNGDVVDFADAHKKAQESGADGVMIGRGMFGNPWIGTHHVPSLEERLKVLVEHTYLFEYYLGNIKSFNIMKKHYKAYVNGFEGAKELREKLMGTENANEVEHIINTHLERLTRNISM
jgi:tRNA-dihydrouridine synthase